MGLVGSRQQSDPDVENVNPPASYRYPPKSGNFFGMHFILGGERFETSQPESYLFGENGDLNFLGTRPVSFPYPAATSSNEPTRTIQSLVNIRRDSVKFVRCQPTPSTPAGLKRTESLTGCEQTSVPSCSTRSSLSSGSKAVQPGAFGLQSNNESTDSGVSFRIPNVPSPGTKTRIDSNESHLLTNNQLLKSLAKIVSPGKASTHEFPNSADAESVRVETSGEFVDSSDEEETDNSSQLGPHAYNLEFTFDCDCPITITVYYFAVEDTGTPNGVTYLSQRPEITSETYAYPMGEGQIFSQPNLIFDPAAFRLEDLRYDPESDIVPVVIHCVAENQNQSHSTLAVVEPSSEGHDYLLKPVKQKLFVDNVGYLLQEIYGIENKNTHDSAKSVPEETADDGGHECVICMSEIRDTLILPCRHLCLCSTCAETLRYKASNCPICRSPFRALLQIKTLKKSKNSSFPNAFNSSNEQNYTNESGFLYRYETVTLVEALNGQIIKVPTAPPAVQRRSSNPNNGDPAKKSPMAPPRTGGKHGKKGLRRAVSPIQEVLTIPHAVVPVSLGNDPDFMESEELPGAIQETALHVRSDSESRGSPSLGSKLHRRSSRQSDFTVGGYHNRSFTHNGLSDHENASVVSDTDQFWGSEQPEEQITEAIPTDMCPYRIVVNNSAAKLNTAADQLKTNGNSDQSEKLGRLVVGSESQLVNEEPGPRKMEKRVFSGNKYQGKTRRLSRSSEDVRNPDVMEMSHQNHQGMEDISNSEGIPLSSEGMPVTPRLDVDTPATTRSGTPASNHSFSSVSSTKPLLKQNDSQKNLEDEV